MKKVFLSSAVVLLLAFGAGAQLKTDREKQLLLGPVRSVRGEVTKVEVKDGVALEGPRKTTYGYVFDAEGRYSEMNIYNEEGTLISTLKYFYDGGRCVGVENYSRAGKLIYRSTRSHDPAGRVQASTAYDAAGAVTGRTVFVYGPGDGSVEMSSYDGAERLLTRRVTTKDGSASRIVETGYHPDGSVRYRNETSLSADRSAYASADYRADGSLEFVEESAGDLPHGAAYNADGTGRRTYHYVVDERDAHGNWTKRTAWAAEAGKTAPAHVYYRTITYQ